MKPYTKVTAGALAGAISVVALWILEATTGVQVPAPVASAVTVILTFATSYIVPETSS